MSLLVVGSIALDSVETPTANGATTCWADRPCFSPMPPAISPRCAWSAWWARIGPAEHTKLLESRGIDTAGLQRLPGAKTFRWRGKYQPNMNDRETLEIHLNVFADFNPVLPAAYRDCRFLFLANGSPGCS